MKAVNELVLSLFPGVGLLDKAFTSQGFSIVQVADKITGGDVRYFRGVRGRLDGIVAGPPCQGFSVANNKRKDSDHPSVINSREMLRETCRIILECQPSWFLIENVPCVPDVVVEGYTVQRIPVTDFEFGGVQHRCRHIQFGSKHGHVIRPIRVNDITHNRRKGRPAKAVTTKTDKWTDYPDLCRRQGLSRPIELPGWYRTAKFKAVGNGVPLMMGKAIAEAVKFRSPPEDSDCQCGCGRWISPRALTATASCRKRKQMASAPRPWVDVEGFHYGR